MEMETNKEDVGWRQWRPDQKTREQSDRRSSECLTLLCSLLYRTLCVTARVKIAIKFIDIDLLRAKIRKKNT